MVAPKCGDFELTRMFRRFESFFEFLRQKIVIGPPRAAVFNTTLKACDVENTAVATSTVAESPFVRQRRATIHSRSTIFLNTGGNIRRFALFNGSAPFALALIHSAIA